MRNFASVFTIFILSVVAMTSASAQFSVSVAKTDPTCAGYTNGSAVANPTGGVAPYRYNWSTGATTNSISGVGAGNYSVTVTGANNATAVGSTTITAATAINVNFSFSSICSGGAVTANVTGGTGPYTINWGGGRVGATQSGLAAGGYNVVVTDSKGCSVNKFVNVPVPFTAGIRIGELLCFGDCDAGIDALPQGGVAPFTYRWNTGATTAAIIGLPSGTYSVTITDANGCTGTATGTVTNPPSVTLNTTTVAPGCGTGGSSSGSATVSAVGGRPPFTYRWSNGQTSATATGLAVGTYFVTATDAKGCNKTASVTLTSSAGFTLSATGANASCGSSNGSAAASITGGTAPFRYTWSTGATTQTISNLGAGSYTVTVSDASGCSSVATATVNAVGSLAISLTSTNAACGIANGSVTATATSGTAPFRYAWSNGATTQTIGVLGAGTYTVTVTDASGCTATGSRTITQTTSFDVNLDARNVACNGGTDGQISAMVMGGSAPYTYRWSNGSTIAVIANLGANSYSLTVTDASGCTAIKSATITQPSAVTATATSTASSCGATNGSATVVAGGGTAPYTYAWTNGGSTATISNLGAGTYTVSVTDSKACRTTRSVTISSSTNLDAAASVTNVRCNGANSGAIALTVTGATGAISYSWSNGATTATLANLTAGTYSVTVNDSRNCSVVKQFSVTQPSAFTTSVSGTMSSCGSSNGTLTATTTGGTAPFRYAWSNGATTASISGLVAGTYTVVTTDANGCTSTGSMVITRSTAITVATSVVAVRCNGAATGSATATVTGGAQPYRYAWSNGGTTATISNVAAATYAVTVTDAVGCTSTQIATITQPTAISMFVDAVDAVCTNGTGRITNTVSGGTAPYSYAWNTGATTPSLTNLSGGTYTFTVTDASGCTRVSTTVITYIAPPTVNLTATNISCNGGNTGGVAAVVTGGTAPFSYAWSNNATNASISGLSIGAYTVTVTDSKGCTATRTISVTQAAALVITPTVVSATCLPVGSIAIAATGGSGSYTYLWSNGMTTATISNLAGGNYTVTVTDGSGCRNSLTVNVPAVTSNLSSTIALTKSVSYQGASDGEATVTAVNGRAPYTYRWSNGSTLATTTGLKAGTYTVTITDANGCTTTNSITVTEPVCVQLTSAGTITGNQTFCNPSELTGITELTAVAGGTGAVEYLWMWSDFTADFSVGGWNTIVGATGKDLPANLLPNMVRATNFIRCVRRAGCDLYLEGNTVTKTPMVAFSFQVERYPCLNRPNVFTAADNGTGATYQWTFTGANVTFATTRVANVTFTSLGAKSVTLSISKGGCVVTRNVPIDVVNCLADYGNIFAFSVSTTGSNGVKLNWATTDEKKASKYMVEKSIDNVNFSLIGTVASQNLPSNLYNFSDPQPKQGRAFYRIHQMNMQDVDVNMSKTERVVVAEQGQSLVSYPNPAGANLFVEVVDMDNTEGTIDIYSETGALVKTQRFTANQVRYEVDTHNLGRGNYIVKVRRADGTVTTTKFSKF
ncbi:MAG: T9SS type A sorting domain-containing protein [Saprospiraceae bacterium]|nr:T9SS type A sorting domain-containing protein [Saprospiraceae bacterium]